MGHRTSSLGTVKLGYGTVECVTCGKEEGIFRHRPPPLIGQDLPRRVLTFPHALAGTGIRRAECPMAEGEMLWPLRTGAVGYTCHSWLCQQRPE